MSILFRKRPWLTFAQITHTWARQLARAHEDMRDCEQNLRHVLCEDIINGRLDDAGPLIDGNRLGLAEITPEGGLEFFEGRRLSEFARDFVFLIEHSLYEHSLIVMKEAVLDFARRHEIPPPSWWADEAGASIETTSEATFVGAASELTADFRNLSPARPPRRRGRKPIKFMQTKDAMKNDIEQGRFTVTDLRNMLEKQLKETYGVSRDTARKARNAVLSEFAEN